MRGRELIAILRRAGFEVVRIKGSHHYLRHPDGRATVVPVHAGEDIGIGLLGKILKDVEWTTEELRKKKQFREPSHRAYGLPARRSWATFVPMADKAVIGGKVNWSNGRFRNGVVERSSVAGSPAVVMT